MTGEQICLPRSGQIDRGVVLAAAKDAARRFAVACGHP
jgi:hypothetical protein